MWWVLTAGALVGYFEGPDIFGDSLGSLIAVPFVMGGTLLSGNNDEFELQPLEDLAQPGETGLFYRRARTRADWMRSAKQSAIIGMTLALVIVAGRFMPAPVRAFLASISNGAL